MLELTRCVRFCVNDATKGTPEWGDPLNTFAAYPSMRGMGRYYELEVRCRGTPSESTGYFLNIKQIDQAVRSAGIPVIERACRERPWMDPAGALLDVSGPVNDALGGRVTLVRWKLTPYYSVEMSPPTIPLIAGEPPVLLRQQFEFAASHRLHSASLTEMQHARLTELVRRGLAWPDADGWTLSTRWEATMKERTDNRSPQKPQEKGQHKEQQPEQILYQFLYLERMK